MKKFTKTTVQTVAILFATLFFTYKVNAQLYSSGNNSITGNNVGVGTSTPNTSLFVKPPTYLISGKSKTSPFHVEYYDNPVVPPGNASLPSYASAIFVKWDGLIGIHTNNPLEKFHVNSNSLFTGNMTVGNNNWTSLTLDGTADNNWMFNAHNDGEKFHIRSFYNNAYQFRMTFMRSTGYIGINNTAPEAQLHVNGNAIVEGALTIKDANGTNQFQIDEEGNVRSREIKVDLAFIPNIPDYVFAEDYKLMPLAEVKAFIEKNKHLPNIKSEAEFKEDGSISLAEMNMTLLEKVEELTLYILQQQEQINMLQTQFNKLKK